MAEVRRFRENGFVTNGDDDSVPERASCDEPGLRVRHAGRVVLLDPDNRVLLMRYDDGPPNGIHWSTPGGGLNQGEDYASAARRELSEETGWTDITVLGEIHRRAHVMEYDDVILRQHERFYLARTDQARRQITGVEAMHVADGIAAWRWWSLAEMDATGEAIWPSGLADLIRAALTDE
jgi:ADP-ribose pyrophosphatase YjhB (NUDIX family)